MLVHSMFILPLKSEEIISYFVGCWVLIDEDIYKEQHCGTDGYFLLTHSSEDIAYDTTLRADG